MFWLWLAGGVFFSRPARINMAESVPSLTRYSTLLTHTYSQGFVINQTENSLRNSEPVGASVRLYDVSSV